MVIYLHGFCSSPAAWKSQLLAEEMALRGMAAQFICPPLSPVPDEAVASISRLIEQASGPVTLIGSSLGGHYANHLTEKYGVKAVLINPATVAHLDLARFVGDHANFHSGERFTFTEAHAAQLRAQVRQPTPALYWLLAETGDEVLDYRHAVDFYAGCRQTVVAGGDHGFTQFPGFIPQIIEFAGL
ncbi:esterase [Dechloromonas sp. HYN0024]|nr:esterase [Dechloromonas sp. HYN0024]